jgi:hypothetical protein
VIYWICAAILSALALGLCIVLAVAVFRQLKMRRIDIDAIVLFAGSVLGLFFMIWLLPKGFE